MFLRKHLSVLPESLKIGFLNTLKETPGTYPSTAWRVGSPRAGVSGTCVMEGLEPRCPGFSKESFRAFSPMSTR